MGTGTYAVVSTHRLEEASDQVWPRLHESVFRIVRVNLDGRQFVSYILWVNEVVFVDEPDSAGILEVIAHLYVSPNVLHQSPVHVPGLDHGPVDRQSHARP